MGEGGGGWLGPPSSRVPLWSPPKAGRKFLSLKAGGSRVGRGVQGGGVTPPPYGVQPF